MSDRLEELGMELRSPGYNAREWLFHFTTFSDFPWVVTSIRLEGFTTCVCILGRGTQRLNRKWELLFVAVFLGCTSTGRVGLCFLWFFVQELLEAQPAVVLVLKRLRRRGKWLEVSSNRLGELGIDDIFKRFRLSMHFLTINTYEFTNIVMWFFFLKKKKAPLFY